ncbi:tripartite tricarboxylate transporter substrate binding protein [Candidimonas sp. SYP-B2681]|uniref:Bug family tripartite tricarboxylate transporter substrate binding protein n=1 Tax=Candidimonas sp. SYP-B2681 TaxID=2497686 RepID=UPI000F88FA8E|nr:tripartite tricarboxylate transporter substrate binding protein [Candidimonas sp. SYP-B2681]RTZ48223.1 tripartite tricarboxylate transporter substrate binding protein [Candidimonas sp. SYP-B2681]
MHKNLRTLVGSILAATLMGYGAAAAGDAYPTKPIRLIIPFAPGGAVDQIGRTISPRLAEILGQSVVVDNRAGGSGSIGAAEVARAAPDGYTLALVLDSHAVNHHMVKNLAFDTLKSFDYLSLLVTLPQVLVAKKNFPANTVPELIEYIKTNKSTAYGSAGTGSAGHVNTATMAVHYNVEPTHIPYRGAGPLLTDLLGGHIDFAFAGLSVMLPQIEGGALKAIATSTAERSTKLPNVPAVSESIPGFEIPTWIGLLGPANLKPDVKARILAAIQKTMKDPVVQQKLHASAFNIVTSSPEEFLARVNKDDQTMATLVKDGVVKFE